MEKSQFVHNAISYSCAQSGRHLHRHCISLVQTVRSAVFLHLYLLFYY